MAREYGGSDTVLLQDNVSLDGRGCLVFAQFLDAVGAGGAGAEHLEDRDGFPDDRFARGNRCAIDEGVGVADAAHDSIFRVGPTARHCLPRRCSRSSARRVPPMNSCATVPPVIATGCHPSNS